MTYVHDFAVRVEEKNLLSVFEGLDASDKSGVVVGSTVMRFVLGVHIPCAWQSV